MFIVFNKYSSYIGTGYKILYKPRVHPPMCALLKHDRSQFPGLFTLFLFHCFSLKIIEYKDALTMNKTN